MARRTFARFLFSDRLKFTLRSDLRFEDRIAGVICGAAFPNLAEPSAFLAGTMRRIEGEQPRIEFLKRAPATGATHLCAHHREPTFRIEQMRGAAPDIE